MWPIIWTWIILHLDWKTKWMIRTTTRSIINVTYRKVMGQMGQGDVYNVPGTYGFINMMLDLKRLVNNSIARGHQLDLMY